MINWTPNVSGAAMRLVCLSPVSSGGDRAADDATPTGVPATRVDGVDDGVAVAAPVAASPLAVATSAGGTGGSALPVGGDAVS